MLPVKSISARSSIRLSNSAWDMTPLGTGRVDGLFVGQQMHEAGHFDVVPMMTVRNDVPVASSAGNPNSGAFGSRTRPDTTVSKRSTLPYQSRSTHPRISH